MQQIIWRHDPPTHWYKVHYTDLDGNPRTTVGAAYYSEDEARERCDAWLGAGNYRLEPVDPPQEPANVADWSGNTPYGAGRTAFEMNGHGQD